MLPDFFRQLFGPTLQRTLEAGALAAPEIASWWEPLDSAARAGRFFTALTGFIGAGAKP
jgi:hypothetical protein